MGEVLTFSLRSRPAVNARPLHPACPSDGGRCGTGTGARPRLAHQRSRQPAHQDPPGRYELDYAL